MIQEEETKLVYNMKKVMEKKKFVGDNILDYWCLPRSQITIEKYKLESKTVDRQIIWIPQLFQISIVFISPS
jgi:hypothetical protein